MSERSTAAASIARGLAVIAIAVAGVVSVRVLARLTSAESTPAVPVCTVPVELVDRSGRQTVCADDMRLAACGNLVAGDLATVGAEACAVRRQEMSAAARLLEGMPIDINRAAAADLMLLDGIGPATSAAIIEAREAGGPFRSVDGLQRARGIGPATVDKLRPFVTVGAESKR